MDFYEKRQEVVKDVKQVQQELGKDKISFDEFEENSEFTLSDLTRFFGSVDEAGEEIGVELQAPKKLYEI